MNHDPTYKKTLCLGGSFNPPHFGHLICARTVAEKLGFDKIMLIPSGQPPHKTNSNDLADPLQRLAMCELAAKSAGQSGGVKFEVCDLEIRRSGPSYTVDTVRKLKEQGWQKVPWLIGADMLNYLPKWHEAAALLREAEFVIVARPGIPILWDSLPPEFSILKNNVVTAPLIEISSTEIRRRMRDGLSIDYLTLPEIVRHIHSAGLYRT